MRHLRAASALLIGCALGACDSESRGTSPSTGSATSTVAAGSASIVSKAAKLDDYTLRGIQFVYFRIPAGLSREHLIEIAQALHEQQPKAQLVLVDDDSKVKEYVTYVKAISGQGELKEPVPQEWADAHIVANVQLYTSGRFVLCEGNGSKEIADLR